MALDEDSALETLTTLTLAIGEDKQLRRWFDDLASKPAGERAKAIRVMSKRISTEGRDGKLAQAVGLLVDARIFAAAQAAMSESRRDK